MNLKFIPNNCYKLLFFSEFTFNFVLVVRFKKKESTSLNSPRKAAVFYLLFFLFSIFVTVLTAEIYIRFVMKYQPGRYEVQGKDYLYPVVGLAGPWHYTFDVETGYSLIKNMVDRRRLISTDSFGNRMTKTNFDPQKKSLLFVGDSTVFGWGVKDEDTFSSRISEILINKDLNVLNLGVPSYSLGNILAVLQKKAPLLNPKYIVVAILWPWKPYSVYQTDKAWKEIDFDFYKKNFPERDKFNEDVTKPPLLFSLEYLRDLITQIKFKDQIKRNMTRPGVRDFNISEPEEKSFAMDHVVSLKSIADRFKQQGIEVLFYIHPYQYTVFHPDYQNLGKVGKQVLSQELKAFDPTAFLKSKFENKEFYIDGSHLTTEGHKVFCDFLISTILKDKLELSSQSCYKGY